MLSWFNRAPKCPVDQQAKNWIEENFAWLSDEFGIETLREAQTVTPTAEFLPAKYKPTEPMINELLERVSRFMNIDPTSLVLSYYEDDKPIVGETEIEQFSTDNNCEIWLEANSLQEPNCVVAALTREIAHVRLVLKHPQSTMDEDHEELSELLAVFSGLGIFLANTAFYDSNWTSEGWTGWSVGKLSHLSMDMFGYAFALYALARDENTPEWANFLRPDVRHPFEQGKRYILATKDCGFVPALEKAV